MLNKVILIGRLTKDPEVRTTPSNVSVATFTLAVDRSYTNQQGEREADFIPVVVWRNLAETCGKYLTKGRLTAVSGRLQVRNYEGNDGQRRNVTEVVADEVQFLERNTNTTGNAPASGFAQYPIKGVPNTGFEPLEGEDDELPF
jgi:single-strand DNA-binding protein